MAPQLRKTVGSSPYVQERLVLPYFRNAVRDVVSGYEVKNIYAEKGRKEIAAKIRDFLQEQLEPRGVQIVDVLLRDVKLPERFRDSIEAKLTAEQRVQQTVQSAWTETSQYSIPYPPLHNSSNECRKYSISRPLVCYPTLALTVPSGNVPITLCAEGAQ